MAGLSRLSKETIETTSPERQRDIHAAHRNFYGASYDPRPFTEGGDLFEDIDFSGWAEGVVRPGYERLKELIPTGTYHAVSIWKLNRIARRTREVDDFRELCVRHGVALIAGGSIMDWKTPGGHFMATVLAGVGEMESAQISEAVRAAFEKLKPQGRWLGGTPPFGWMPVPYAGPNAEWDQRGAGKRLELNLDEAEYLQEAIDRFIRGESMASICRDFSIRGVQTRRARGKSGTEWHGVTLGNLFRNPILIGQHRAYGTLEPGHGWKPGRVVTDEAGIPIRPHQPLLSDDAWNQLQDELNRRKYQGERRNSKATLLSGLVWCGRCAGEDLTEIEELRPEHLTGRKMVGRSRDHVDAFYSCEGRKYGTCVGNNAKRNFVDDLVAGAALRKCTVEYLEERRAKLIQQGAATTQLNRDPITDHIQELSTALSNLQADRIAGLYNTRASEDLFRRQFTSISEELERLEQKQELAKTAITDLQHIPKGKALSDVWPDLTQEERRTVLGQLIRGVVIMAGRRGAAKGTNRGPVFNPERVKIVWRSSESR